MKSSNIPKILFISWLNSYRINCNDCCLSETVMYLDMYRLVFKALINFIGPISMSCKLLPELNFGMLF